jgi:hypothetical protein
MSCVPVWVAVPHEDSDREKDIKPEFKDFEVGSRDSHFIEEDTEVRD